MTNNTGYEIIVTPAGKVAALAVDGQLPLIIIQSQQAVEEHIIEDNAAGALKTILAFAARPDTQQLVFISADDQFVPSAWQECLAHCNKATPDRGFALFIPYKQPPAGIKGENPETPNHSQREDGKARSFLVATKFLKAGLLTKYFADWARLAYELLYAYLNATGSNNIEVFQVGKKQSFYKEPDPKVMEALQRSLMVIPHKDSVKLLKRCLLHLNQAPFLPGAVNLCFDDDGYSKMKLTGFNRLKKLVKIYKNAPDNVGPYPPRHYSIARTDKEYIFFQDSDDISVDGRFVQQLAALQERGLDMIGSHELRVDEFEKAILLIRFPLDVSSSLAGFCFHPLFHPTALISRNAYLKTGGFSTNLRFGYDSQFLLRSHFYLKIGNIDEFLYIRFKRPNSLTTDPKTSLGSGLRTYLIGRWLTDFKLVTQDKMDLQDSSLSVQKHEYDYELVEIP